MPDVMTTRELAEYLRLSERSVYRLLERGEIPAVKVGGQWRFRKSAVDEWLDLRFGGIEHAELDAGEDDDAGAPAACAAPTLADAIAQLTDAARAITSAVTGGVKAVADVARTDPDLAAALRDSSTCQQLREETTS